jgi:molybdate transport system substrate-binding protein
MRLRTILAALLACGLLAGVARAAGPYDFTVPGVDDVPDLHGNPAGAQLVIFAAGNQYMVMPRLIAAFEREHPGVTRVFYETLPPGILAKQMAAGGIRIGNLVVADPPDVYLAGKKRMAEEIAAGAVIGPPVSYATNVLAIMVAAGNPKHITSLRDLGRPDVRVSMPNPAWEGIARQIEAAYRKTGGEALVHTIMVTKVANGTTVLTKIHHRQTPMRILDGRSDAGPVWISEALWQARLTHRIGVVRIPPADNERAVYQAAVAAHAPHAALARAFVRFIASPTARAIYASYGFGSPQMPGS